MGKLISLSETKSILQISGSSQYDGFINTMIPIVEDFALNYCNITEDSASVSPGIKLPLAQLIKYQLNQPSNIQSETIGNYSVSFTTSYPAYLLSGLKPYRRIKFIQDTRTGDGWVSELEAQFEEDAE